jgi:hypothetical protein
MRTMATKSKIILLPSIISLVIMFISCSFTGKGKGQYFILPKGFIGEVLIISEVKDGVKPLEEDNKVVYVIPENGILKISTTLNYDWIAVSEKVFYEFDKETNTKSFINYDYNIPYKQAKPTIIDSTIVAFSSRSGSFQKDRTNRDYKFYSFLIGKKSQSDSLFSIREKRNYSSSFE